MAQPQHKPSEDTLTFTLPDLPYPKDALEPHISKQTMEFHHGKHHKAYVDKANELVKGTALEGAPLEEAVLKASHEGGPLFNNIGQIYNHNIFWQSMSPDGGGKPGGELASKIETTFGSYDEFRKQFIAAGTSQFGSGWVWLAWSGGKIELLKTANADTPLADGKTPLLVCDVWEHAYYLDYQNKRADFLEVFLDELVNWKFAEEQLAKAQG